MSRVSRVVSGVGACALATGTVFIVGMGPASANDVIRVDQTCTTATTVHDNFSEGVSHIKLTISVVGQPDTVVNEDHTGPKFNVTGDIPGGAANTEFIVSESWTGANTGSCGPKPYERKDCGPSTPPSSSVPASSSVPPPPVTTAPGKTVVKTVVVTSPGVVVTSFVPTFNMQAPQAGNAGQHTVVANRSSNSGVVRLLIVILAVLGAALCVVAFIRRYQPRHHGGR